MQRMWLLLLHLEVYLVGIDEAAQPEVAYSTAYQTTYEDTEQIIVYATELVNLTCTYPTAAGETIAQVAWDEYSGGSYVSVFNSNGMAGAVQPGTLYNRATSTFSDNAHTLTIPDYMPSDSTRFRCRVGSNVEDLNDEIDFTDSVVEPDDLVGLSLNVDFDGYDNVAYSSGRFELDIVVENPEIGGSTNLCADINVSVDGEETTCDRLTCSGAAATCHLTIEENQYRDTDIAIEATASFLSATNSGSLTLRYRVKKKKDDDDDASFPAWAIALCVVLPLLVIGGIVAAAVFHFHNNRKKKRKTEKEKESVLCTVLAEVTNAKGQNLDAATGKHHCEEIVEQLKKADSRVTTELKHEYNLEKLEVTLEGDQKFKLNLSPKSDTLCSDVESNVFGEKIKKKCKVGHKKTYEVKVKRGGTENV